MMEGNGTQMEWCKWWLFVGMSCDYFKKKDEDDTVDEVGRYWIGECGVFRGHRYDDFSSLLYLRHITN